MQNLTQNSSRYLCQKTSSSDYMHRMKNVWVKCEILSNCCKNCNSVTVLVTVLMKWQFLIFFLYIL